MRFSVRGIKSNNNDIGYFHQDIFLISKAVKSHRQAGMLFTESRWNTNARWRYCTYNICRNEEQTQYYEFCIFCKNIYKKCKDRFWKTMIVHACWLKQLQKKSQNIKWSTKVDGKNVQHRLIRRVSMDQFYANSYWWRRCIL